VIGIILCVFAGLTILGSIIEIMKESIAITAFMHQVKKLVLSNNIDRAIKLCNCAPHSTLAVAAKKLLTRANKNSALYQTFLQAKMELEIESWSNKSATKWALWNLTLAIGFFTAGSMYNMLFEGALLCGIAYTSFSLAQFVSSFRHKLLCKEIPALEDLLQTLMERLGVTAPDFALLDNPSQELLAKQEKLMEAFERSYTKDKDAGRETRPVEAVFLEKIDLRTGLFPA